VHQPVYVEPLQKGEQVLSGHFGGPVAKVPGIGAIPIPFTSIGYGKEAKQPNNCFWQPTPDLIGFRSLDNSNLGLLKNSGTPTAWVSQANSIQTF